jgi:ABC-2 type transport system ATP-binding protein
MPQPLALDDVTKRYGDGPPVIDGFSRTFAPGSLTVLAGPNGSGKTTLLSLLSVLAYPSSGTVHYGDLDVHAQPYRYLARVGVVHAETALPEHLTAVELLEWVLRSRDDWDEDASERIGGLLDRLHLDERRVNLLGTYSTGMIKKVQIAAALITDPEVLIMDEPLRGLDDATTEATTALLRDFVDDGGLAVVASHLTGALAPLGGTVLQMGPAGDVGGANGAEEADAEEEDAEESGAVPASGGSDGRPE